ncbi:MAG TPA: division/cell wall cluster transcriptional repressor MraZ [Clostridia bacterium]|nr:division/cell wall cluster transcriptional repressor MraZ [Clostridia bacterium]
MLIGEYQHLIDEKGRVTVPARLREGLGEKFIMARGLENCLFLFPMDEWARIQEKLKSLSLTRSDARAFTRFLFSGAQEAQVDRQGRVLISPNLREYAALDKEVVLVGVSTRAEIWAKEQWERYKERAGASFAEVAEKLADIEL